jgi:carbonic anhydrase/acetyltransferase-like protein (isoleucine patch superfamily)
MCGWGRTAASCPGPVLTAAESGCVEVGERCIVMENALLRGRDSHPVVLGDHVLVGPHAHVNGGRIENEVFLATGVSVFPGALVGRGSEVCINGVVHVNSRLEPNTTVPIGWVAAGDPARPVLAGSPRAAVGNPRADGFPRTVFGLAREEATMDRVCARYAERFGRHREDRVLE